MKSKIIGLENSNKSTLPVITKSLISQADELAEEHEQFNATYIVGGRLALYELLSKIFALYKSLEIAPDKKHLLGDMKHKMLHTYRIRVQSNSSDIGILVRYITRADRKTAHVYARVIETAIANKISVDEFCDYIQRSGGIEQIRSIGVDPESSAQKERLAKDSWDLAWKYCQAREELPFATFDLKKDLDYGKNRGVTFEYFACAKRNGKRYVLAKIPADQAFEERAVRLLGDYFMLDLENAKEQVAKLVDKSKAAYKDRIARELPSLAKILEAQTLKEKEG